MLHADQILVKPIDSDVLIDVIKERLLRGSSLPRPIETVAAILERTADLSISEWLGRVHKEQSIMAVSMHDETPPADLESTGGARVALGPPSLGGGPT